MESLIPVCYFPTTVMFVDDREHFLTGLALNLPRNLTYQMYTNPQKALKAYKSQSSVLNLGNVMSGLGGHEAVEFDDLHAHGVTDIDISRIHELMYCDDRFKEISVVVVDYAMPEFNGLEFCRALKDFPVKKLMVTGEATDDLAVQAFNEGVINQFIKKHDADFSEKLHQKIADLQKAYFEDFSKPILMNLLAQKQSCLTDPFFANLFKEIFEKHEICEYYLFDERGSFLFLDAKSKCFGLIIVDEKFMDAYENIAKDNDGPVEIQKILENREKIPFFLSNTEMEEPVSEWHRFLHPATVIKSRGKKFYYTIIEDFSNYQLKKPVLSYQGYLDAIS